MGKTITENLSDIELDRKLMKNRTKGYQMFFDQYLVEDVEDMNMILGAAAIDFFNTFDIRHGYLETDPVSKRVTPHWQPSKMGLIAVVCYNEIINYIQKKKLDKNLSEFAISVADRFVIGYSNDDSEDMQVAGVDNEVVGNFAPYIIHNDKKFTAPYHEPSMKATDRCTQWVNTNVTSSPAAISEIQDKAKRKLDDLGIKLLTANMIMPTFVWCYEFLINHIKTMRAERDDFEYSVNFLNLFTATCIEDGENGEDKIIIRPNIKCKLDIKDNSKASAKYDD